MNEPQFWTAVRFNLGTDDFEIAGIFTNQSDATAFLPQIAINTFPGTVDGPMSMETIIDNLVKDRLLALAEPIDALIRLAKARGL